jgi:hypothetical protein
MKHIKLFEEHEKSDMISVIIKAEKTNSDNGTKVSYHCFVYPTLWDITKDLLEEFMPDANIDSVIDRMYVLSDLNDFDNDEMGDPPYDFWDFTIWSGLTPRSQTKKHEIIESTLPWTICEKLENMFPNASSVMKKDPNGIKWGKDDDIDIVVASLKNDKSKLGLYGDSEYLEEIKAKLGWSEEIFKSALKAYGALRYT